MRASLKCAGDIGFDLALFYIGEGGKINIGEVYAAAVVVVAADIAEEVDLLECGARGCGRGP